MSHQERCKWIAHGNIAALVYMWLLVGEHLYLYRGSPPLEVLCVQLVVCVAGIVASLYVWEFQKGTRDPLPLMGWGVILLLYTLLPLMHGGFIRMFIRV